MAERDFNFSSTCLESCPIVHKAICTEIGRQAIELGKDSMNLSDIRVAINGAFANTMGAPYVEDCSGAVQETVGETLILDESSHRGIMMEVCERHRLR